MEENEKKVVEVAPQVTQAIEKPVEPPMSSAEFSATLDQLMTRAKAAGVRPLQVMATSYAKQGLAMLDGLLASLDQGTSADAKKTDVDELKKRS